MDDTVSAGPAAQPVGDGTFDAYYFAHCCGAPYQRDAYWLTFFGAIADRIVADIQPRRVLDAGCALGILVETLRTRGVDAEGIDLSSYAIANVYEPIRPFCRLGSIADELPEAYDLIVSIEVLEHMPVRDGEAAIANFCRHTDDVLFSSTPNDHRELSHVNVQPVEYWAELFARQGFYRDVDFDASFLTPWAVRFRRGRDPFPRLVRGYERRYAALAVMSHDARTFSAELQRDLAQARAQLARVAALEQERATLREAIDQTHANLTRKTIALDAADERAASLDHALAHARQTIHLMEQSLFWRARRLWVTIARALGRST